VRWLKLDVFLLTLLSFSLAIAVVAAIAAAVAVALSVDFSLLLPYSYFLLTYFFAFRDAGSAGAQRRLPSDVRP
jgi:hypothetical protein